MRRIAIAGFAALVLAGPATAGEMSLKIDLSLQADRAAIAGVCASLGYSVDSDALPAANQAAIAQAVSGGLPQADAAQFFQDALSRDTTRTQDERASMAAAAKDDADDREKTGELKIQAAAFVSRMKSRCDRAVTDQIYRTVFAASDAGQMAAAQQALTDEILAPAGAASWQTPHILAQADLLYAVGLCRPKLPAADVSRYTAILAGPEPADPAQARIRRYYALRFQWGVDNIDKYGFDATQCGRVMATRLADLKVAP